MKTYLEGDQIIIYCITFEDTRETITHAWTDDKELAKWYLKFHHSKRMKLKRIDTTYEDARDFISNYMYEQIKVGYLMTKHPRKKGSVTIPFPVTDAERQFLDDEVADLCNGYVGYQTIYEMAPFLKRKWESLLMKDLQLYSVLEYVINNHIGKIEWITGMDEVRMLQMYMPDKFD